MTDPTVDRGYALASETAERMGTGIRFGQFDDPDPDGAWYVVVARGAAARIMVKVAGQERTTVSPAGLGWFLRSLLHRRQTRP